MAIAALALVVTTTVTVKYDATPTGWEFQISGLFSLNDPERSCTSQDELRKGSRGLKQTSRKPPTIGHR